MQQPSILIVEDEAIVALDLQLQLEELGYHVCGTAASAERAVDVVARTNPHLVLMDVRLQGTMDGIDAAEIIRSRFAVPVIFLTSHSDHETVQRAARTAAYGFLTKPYQIREVRAGIEVALTKSQMERQLREADRWFAHTLRCVADGVVVTDPASQVRFLNPAAEELTGWSADEAMGRRLADVVQMADAPGGDAHAGGNEALRLVEQVLREGRAAPIRHGRPLRHREGKHRVIDGAAGPVDDDQGQRLGAVLVLRDAAQRLAQEAQLRASEARFRSAFDFAPLGMALVSFAGEFLQVNDALCALLGRSRDALCTLGQSALTHPADAEHEQHRLRELLASTAGVVQFEKRFLRGGEDPAVWALVSVSLLRGQGEPACFLYQIHDLSEQKRAAEHLAALADERMRREASELASAAKTEFLSRVSHEMRTPLNAVMGFAQLLELRGRSPDPDLVAKYARRIHNAGAHLLALVTDLLDLNQVAQGALKLQLTAVSLSATVHEALDLLRGQAEAHGIAIEAQVPVSTQVQADAQRLRQVLLNVGSNAIKYNRKGGKVWFEASAATDGVVTVRVRDQGIGMTPEQLQRLFQPFERLGAELTSVPGTGLGLMIARGLVVDMGGSLKVESRPREGTTVSIALQATTPHQAAA